MSSGYEIIAMEEYIQVTWWWCAFVHDWFQHGQRLVHRGDKVLIYVFFQSFFATVSHREPIDCQVVQLRKEAHYSLLPQAGDDGRLFSLIRPHIRDSVLALVELLDVVPWIVWYDPANCCLSMSRAINGS